MLQRLRKKANICYQNQCKRCYTKTNPRYKDNGAKGINVLYSQQEFVDWFITNYPKKKERWSVGRIDHSKSYSFDNIRFETLAENSLERIIRRGPTKARRKVLIIDCISGEDVFVAESILEACKLTGIDPGHARRHCLGFLKKSPRGFTLRYAEETKDDRKKFFKKKPKKKILIIDFKTNKVIDTAMGTTEASKKTGICREHVGKYCDGKLKKSLSGLTFRWG